MTRLEIIRLIGDVLTEIDVTVGSLAPADPNVLRLQDLRRLIDARQLMISRMAFDENTTVFREAAIRLKAAGDDLAAAIDRLDDVTVVLSGVTRFLAVLTDLVALAGVLA